MEEERKYCVYKHTNKVNGKIYIGQTCQAPEQRWRNGKGYKDSPYFYYAIKKYGWDNFEHEVLFTGLTQDEANIEEEELIAKFNTMNQDFGYNLKSGGAFNKFSKELKIKMSQNHCDVSGQKNPMWGKHHTEEAKQRIKEAKTGENNPLYGTHKSKETKEKISNSHKGKHHTQECKKKISITKSNPVRCIEANITYYGASEAERQTGIFRSSILKCCRGKQHTAGGYHWEYVSSSDNKEETENENDTCN